jgi:tetratricopeptide (TPR) repeat protein
MGAYALAIFVGAFLLFQVQPLIAKFLLPWFGGGPGVWTTCMLFFQVVLLGGYGYAHLSSRYLSRRGQVLLHLALTVGAIACLPIIPGSAWKPLGAADPTFHILTLLALCVGLPYFVLSGTAPLLQHWFSRTHPGVSPFRLYALSNVGSLLALLSYPAFFEAVLTRSAQARVWGWGLLIYGLACAWCGLKAWKAAAGPKPETASSVSTPPANASLAVRALWVALPACASVLLLSITNKVCQDVAVIAFLWVLPLAAYLLSFIICFDRPSWYRRFPFAVALVLALGSIAYTLTGGGMSVPLQITVYLAGLFISCMVCHGELYRLKPDPAHLTSFYLLISAGGALGGILVAVIAPLVFTDYFELHWGLLLCGVLFLLVVLRERQPIKLATLPAPWVAGCFGVAALAVVLWIDAHQFASVRVVRTRNFYGVLNVYRHVNQDPTLTLVELMHGRMAHGMQFEHPTRAKWPTLYFSPESGVGRAIAAVGGERRRIGIVGLGAGTLATYAQPGDVLRFYEINPEVERVARQYFTFLKDCPGETSVVLGDARLSLEREVPQNFDLLILDAFNSDSVPMHLLTREAFALYRRHLKDDGAIAVQVSNMSVNLEPVVANLAREFGYHSAVIENRDKRGEWWVLPSTYVLLSRNAEFVRKCTSTPGVRAPRPAAFAVRLWTDDFSALFPVLRWNEFFNRTAPEYVARRLTLSSADDARTAINTFRAALLQEPNSPVALNNLACILATAPDAALRNGTEAVSLAERACALSQNRNAAMLTTLAAAYAEAGCFEDAVSTAERARGLAENQGQKELAERNAQLLELYRRKQPYHQQLAR